jgi:hypothetical protein
VVENTSGGAVSFGPPDPFAPEVDIVESDDPITEEIQTMINGLGIDAQPEAGLDADYQANYPDDTDDLEWIDGEESMMQDFLRGLRPEQPTRPLGTRIGRAVGRLIVQLFRICWVLIKFTFLFWIAVIRTVSWWTYRATARSLKVVLQLWLGLLSSGTLSAVVQRFTATYSWLCESRLVKSLAKRWRPANGPLVRLTYNPVAPSWFNLLKGAYKGVTKVRLNLRTASSLRTQGVVDRLNTGALKIRHVRDVMSGVSNARVAKAREKYAADIADESELKRALEQAPTVPGGFSEIEAQARRIELHQAVESHVRPIIRSGTATYSVWWLLGWKVHCVYLQQWVALLMTIQRQRESLMTQAEMHVVLRQYGAVNVPHRMHPILAQSSVMMAWLWAARSFRT